MSNVAPLTISVASACLAFAAWWTSREKLRLDLYNRRFDVYSRTLDFYHALHKWKPTEAEKAAISLQDSPELENTHRAFIKASREAQFLFDDDSGIHRQLEQLHIDAMGVIGFQRNIAPALSGQQEMLPEYQKFLKRLQEIEDSIPLLEKRMSPYLDFHKLSAFSFW